MVTQTWDEATKWEAEWHGNCVNSLGEEFKQLAYAKRMGLKAFHNGKSPFNFDLGGNSVLDIGGGPYSILLKCCNLGTAVVADPCDYPHWVNDRYMAAGITLARIKGEDIDKVPPMSPFDEAWIYNCLQHVEDPEKVIKNALSVAKIVRVFEWIEYEISEGHLHKLTEANLNEWLGGTGKVERINENTAVGLCFYGIFIGEGRSR